MHYMTPWAMLSCSCSGKHHVWHNLKLFDPGWSDESMLHCPCVQQVTCAVFLEAAKVDFKHPAACCGKFYVYGKGPLHQQTSCHVSCPCIILSNLPCPCTVLASPRACCMGPAAPEGPAAEAPSAQLPQASCPSPSRV